MVQLSAPSPDLIPVQNGKSSEKAPGLTKNSDGFKTALRKEKESRESSASTETTGKKGSPASVPSDSKNENVQKKTALRSHDQTDAALDVKLALFIKKGVIESSRDGSSSLKAVQKSTFLKDHDKNAKIRILSAEEMKKFPDSPVENLLLQTEKDLSADKTAVKMEAAAQTEVKDQPVLQKEAVIMNSSVTAEVKLNGTNLNSKGTSLLKDKKKSAESDVKITVEDRRTVQIRDKSLLHMKEIETGEPPNRVTLEMVPSDDMSGMLTRGEQGDATGKNFVLQTAEEQKGAALLDRQLQDKGTQELTKNIRFVLKDHNEGEIKLILKPESLGKVRINLNLNENHIVGKIIVENNSVRQAFLNNMADLTKALEDSGFSSASLDVSVGGEQAQGRQQYQDDRPVYFNDASLSSLDEQIPVVYEQGGALGQINMMA